MKGNKFCPLNLAFFQIEGNLDSDLSFSGKKITKKSCDIEADGVTLFTLKVYIYREIIFWKEIPFFGRLLTPILIEWLFIGMRFEGLQSVCHELELLNDWSPL